MKSLLELIKLHNCNTDKHSRHSYIQGFYDNYFSSLREKKLNILEIGVKGGGSIKLWKEYFINSKIYGIDTNLIKHASYKDAILISGDAYDKKIVDQLPDLDIVIDDGPHTLESQLKCIEMYFPKLTSTGTIIIEDIRSPFDVARDKLEKKYKSVGGKKEIVVYIGTRTKRQDDDFIIAFKK